MSKVPMPSAIAGLLTLKDATNRSLFFDRGFALYGAAAQGHEKGKAGDEKRDSLSAFREHFSAPHDFESFLARRRQALESLAASCVELTTASRLVVGLGLPHPVETGFLFDRLTGCPYLPGSSVKGLLRATARLVAQGELSSAEPEFFQLHQNRLFGPALGSGATPTRGELVVYDAFPQKWPRLELDVLTPHQGDYYTEGSASVPADWHQPVPVPFLTVALGTPFRFYFRSLSVDMQQEDLVKVEALLKISLDWLGAGGKTSGGYGVFTSVDGSAASPSRSRPDGQLARELGDPDRETWHAALVSYDPGGGVLRAASAGNTAESRQQEAKLLIEKLSPEARERMVERKKRKSITADVDVERVGRSWWLVAVREGK